MTKIIVNYRFKVFKGTTILFLCLSVLISIVAGYFQYNYINAEKEHLISEEQIAIKSEKNAIYSKLNKVVGDLLYLSDNLYSHDDGSGNYQEIKNDWLSFALRKKIYDQIRYIDSYGNEKIRIDFETSKAVVVEDELLQNKKDRYYFSDTIVLGEKDIYVSKLDLNVENGEIENPIEPTLRVAMPYFDINGNKKGIVIINYKAEDMFDSLRSIAKLSHGDINLLNNRGYWLYNQSNPNLEWAFMYEDGNEQNFPMYHPKIWEAIKGDSEGFIDTNDSIFLFSKVITSSMFALDDEEYNIVLGDLDWILVSIIGTDKNRESLINSPIMIFKTVVNKYFYMYLSALIFSFVVSVIRVINIYEQEQIKYFSEYDTMTGVYNRRAGLEKINQIFDKKMEEEWTSSICFLDINGLKQVNDNLGHEKGDELIKTVVEGINRNIRKADFMARLGGDEFIIFFDGLSLSDSEKIWDDVIAEFEKINSEENRRYLISVSHGVEEIKYDSKKYIDMLLDKADKKMYEEKVRIKKDIKIIR